MTTLIDTSRYDIAYNPRTHDFTVVIDGMPLEQTVASYADGLAVVKKFFADEQAARLAAIPIERMLLSVAEVATALNVSEAAAYGLVKSGDIPSLKVGNQNRVYVATLKHWIATNEETNSAATPVNPNVLAISGYNRRKSK